MKRGIVLVLLVALCLPSLMAQKTAKRAVRQYTIEQFMNTEAIGGSAFSPDGKTILYASNRSGIYNAYTVPVTGGPSTQLTASTTDAVFPVSFFPNDMRILYTGDKGGNEVSHIFLRNTDGSVRDLTPEAEARAEFYGWSFDKKSFLFGSNKRDKRFMDIYEMDASTLVPALFYQNDSGYALGAVSNDKRYVALMKTITSTNTDMYLLDRQNGILEHLTPHEGDVTYEAQGFSLDSHTLYYLTNAGSEFTYLNSYSVISKTSAKVESADWDLMYVSFSRNDKYRVTAVNNDARTEIRIVNMKTGKRVKLPEMPNADITSVNISDDEKLMTMYVNGSRSPSNLYVFNFETRKYVRLTNTMNPEINPADLAEVQVVRYASYDGVKIPALLYKPLDVAKGGTAPALVMVHGGPGGQTRVGYSALKQFLVNHGYVIIDVNNRGSSGYGKTFFKMDDLKHGEADLGDCVEAKAFLAKTGYVDTQKIGIMGGSYGGYMVLAALTFRPGEFAVGVNMYGVANWLRTLRSIPPWWESFRKALYEEMGNPETDSTYLYRISPLFHAEKIVKPMIVLQGANDPRVLKVESDEIVEKAKKNGVPVEYVVFPDEGHGFVKKENQITSYKAILEFLDKYLKKS